MFANLNTQQIGDLAYVINKKAKMAADKSQDAYHCGDHALARHLSDLKRELYEEKEKLVENYGKIVYKVGKPVVHEFDNGGYGILYQIGNHTFHDYHETITEMVDGRGKLNTEIDWCDERIDSIARDYGIDTDDLEWASSCSDSDMERIVDEYLEITSVEPPRSLDMEAVEVKFTNKQIAKLCNIITMKEQPNLSEGEYESLDYSDNDY